MGVCGVFEKRARGLELLDGPDADTQLAQSSYAFMRFANASGGGRRVVLDFLDKQVPRLRRAKTLRILDLGAGCCDIPLAIVQWARRNQCRVVITCVDHNRHALEVARRALTDSSRDTITLERADIFTYQPAAPFDYALASMVFHHFTADQIRTLVRRLGHFVRKALLVNDLHRCALNYLTCYATVRPFARQVRHDALLSVRRGFTVRELSDILAQGTLSPTVTTAWFCRIVGIVRFDEKGTA